MQIVARSIRRRALASALLTLCFGMVPVPTLPAQVVSSASPAEQAYRLRNEAIAELHLSAKSAYERKELTEEAYRGVIAWLRVQELRLFTEVHKVTFQDITEHNYWHRSQLKFPTSLQQEAERLGVAGSNKRLP